MVLVGETWGTQGAPVPGAFFLPHIPHGLPWGWVQTSRGGRWLITWVLAGYKMLFRFRPYKGSSPTPLRHPDVLSSVSSSPTNRLTSGHRALKENLVKNLPPPTTAPEGLTPYVKYPPLNSLLSKLVRFQNGFHTYLLYHNTVQ